ncbi:MAG: 30S ribosomal protein S6 [Candidatus Omnitrophica bacterium]|nr:30S ribosomal protein S6 [Candidatus Omnitrophota bacterium]
MKVYEGIFIFPPEVTPEAFKQQERQLEDLIKKVKGAILQRMEWGRKPLGYTVNKFKEGYFLILDFELDPLKVNELRMGLELQEGLMKYMITVKQPSAAKAPAKAPEKPPEKTFEKALEPKDRPAVTPASRTKTSSH